jgi:hypothetical protein
VTPDRPLLLGWVDRLPGLAQGFLSGGFLLPALSYLVLAVDPRFARACTGTGFADFRATGLGPYPFAAALLAWLGLAATLVALAAGAGVLLTRRRRHRGLRWADHGWFLFLVLALVVLLIDLLVVIGVAGAAEPRPATCPA